MDQVSPSETVQQLDHLFQKHPLAIVVLDAENQVLKLNDSAKQLLPEHEAGYVGIAASELFANPPEWHTVETLFSESNVVRNHQIELPNGRRAMLSMAPISGDRNSTRLITLAEITDPGKREYELRKRIQHLEQILDLFPGTIIRLDQSGTILGSRNSRGQNKFPLFDQHLGKPLSDLLPPPVSEIWLQASVRCLQENRTVNFEFKLSQQERIESFECQIRPYPENETVTLIRNSTGLKTITNALRESESRLHATIESIPFEFFVFDSSRRYVLQNSICRKYWGDVIGKRLEDLDIAPETLAIWKNNNDRAWRGETVTGEVTYQLEGKSLCYFNIIAPILQEGDILGILGMNIDISERRDAEQALRDSEERYRRLVDQAPFAIAVYSGERVVFANKACFQLFRADTEKDLIGHPVIEFVPKEFRHLTGRRIRKINHEHYQDRLFEEKMVRCDGQVFDTEIAVVPITYGNKPAYQVVIRDITRRKMAEQALRESESNFRSLAENAHEGIIISDRNGKHLYANLQASNITGYPIEELMTLGFRELVHETDIPLLVDRLKKRIFGMEMPPRYKVDIIKKDGQPLPIEVTAARSIWLGEIAIILVIRDMSEHQHLIDDLENKNEQLDTLNKILSHDLKAPLTTIAGFFTLLKKNYADQLIGEMPHYVDRIHENLLKMDRLINGLHKLYRIGNTEFTFEAIELDRLLTTLARGIDRVQTGVKLEFEILNPLPIVYGQALLLNQVFENLIGNSIKFAVPDTNPRIEIRGTSSGPYLKLVYRDYGVGISEHEKEKVFNMFHRGADSRKLEGVGIGLTLVRKIIHMHKGAIEIRIPEGEGTEFVIKLPLKPPR